MAYIPGVTNIQPTATNNQFKVLQQKQKPKNHNQFNHKKGKCEQNCVAFFKFKLEIFFFLDKKMVRDNDPTQFDMDI